MALTTNLVSYWKLDESSGNAADSVGSNTLTNTNTVTYSAGKINNGAKYVRTSSQYHSITNASQTGLGIIGDLSIGFWMKPTTITPPSTYFMLVDKFGNGSNLSYSVRQNNSNIYFSISSDGTTEHNVSGTTGNLQANVWQYVVVTYTAASHLATFYYNGSSVGTADTIVTSIFNGTANFELANGVDNVTYLYDGMLDEVGVWSRVLSSSEVTQLYNGGSGLQYPFSTVSNSAMFAFF